VSIWQITEGTRWLKHWVMRATIPLVVVSPARAALIVILAREEGACENSGKGSSSTTAVKGEFVTSRRNEKNMKVCGQNTSTTIYNLFNNKF